MADSLTIRVFHQRFQKRLQLSFLSAQVGLDRLIQNRSNHNNLAEIVSFLNLVRPASVVVIGQEEAGFLASQSTEQQQALIMRLIEQQVATLILAQNAEIDDEFLLICSRNEFAVFRSEQDDRSLLGNLRYFLHRALTKSVQLHGVFIEVHSIGTLIIGESGVGKSELALSLISRGHRLIADDMAEFSRIAPDVIDGSHPGLSNDFMEVRGLGVLNVRALFGSNSLRTNKTLRLIVNLVPFTKDNMHQFDRLGHNQNTRKVLDVDIPEMTLPVAPGRNLATLVEAAARNHLLLLNGYNAAEDFIEKQRLAILSREKLDNDFDA